MLNVLFRQSEVEDPYALYAQMLVEQPVYWDTVNNIWAIYSYPACQQLLTAEFACIPNPNEANINPLNDVAHMVAGHLIRIQNRPKHTLTRPLVLRLFQQLRPVPTHALLDAIFVSQERSFDWVAVAAKKLSAQALLQGFGFAPNVAEHLLLLLPTLVKILLPGKPAQTIEEVNTAVGDAYPLIERHIIETGSLRALLDSEGTEDDMMEVMAANLMGLLIQSYDAGRGILSTILLHYVKQNKSSVDHQQLVTEILRYDPPVHNTRRIVKQNVTVDEVEIKAGEAVLLVLAAANRDPQRFMNPVQFDALRPNNDDHLTFGAGAHECLARHYIVKLAVETLEFVAMRYPDLSILNRQIEFEPLVNVRLPKTLEIAF